MNKKICVVTGTRADYGLLLPVMLAIKNSKVLDLQLVVTGAHLSTEFGSTYREILQDGFRIDRKLEMLVSSDTAVAVSKSVGLAIIGFADALDDLRPDILLLLGDRYELLAAASAATIANIPIAHLHGGETTEGAFDEAIRHSITKMAHLHFVTALPHRNRVIQLGEQPDKVFCVGAPGIDNIKQMPLLDLEGLEDFLKCKLGYFSCLITFHPVTLEDSTAEIQMQQLLAALDKAKPSCLIFTMPNADTDGRVLFRQIRDYANNRKYARVYTSLGQKRYLSCLAHVSVVIGNSSSGLIEAPSFKVPTINIGDRQKGRLRATSVVDCTPNIADILNAITISQSPEFQGKLELTINPYGEGNASAQIVEVLEEIQFEGILKKKFYDLPPYNDSTVS